MSPKGLLVTIGATIGFFFLAELAMPGHWERFLDYMSGNVDALTSWIQ